MHQKNLSRFMAVLGINAPLRLAGATDIITVWNFDMDMLSGLFGHTRTNQTEIFFLVTTRRSGIDKRIGTGF